LGFIPHLIARIRPRRTRRVYRVGRLPLKGDRTWTVLGF
jgi:hypothetical protein